MDAKTPEQKEQDRKSKISERVSGLSPELLQLELRKHILTTLDDGLIDLSEEAIVATSMARTIHSSIISIPATVAFTREMGSLSRSRKRLGRVEGCSLAETPVINPQPVMHDRDIEEERRYREAATGERPWWQFWKR